MTNKTKWYVLGIKYSIILWREPEFTCTWYCYLKWRYPLTNLCIDQDPFLTAAKQTKAGVLFVPLL